MRADSILAVRHRASRLKLIKFFINDFVHFSSNFGTDITAPGSATSHQPNWRESCLFQQGEVGADYVDDTFGVSRLNACLDNRMLIDQQSRSGMTSATTEQVSPRTLRKVIVAAGIGNFVEWFDFAVYGFLATTIAQQFFPSGDASAALLKTCLLYTSDAADE